MDDRENSSNTSNVLIGGVIVLLLLAVGGAVLVWTQSQRTRFAALREMEAARHQAELTERQRAETELALRADPAKARPPADLPSPADSLDELNQAFRAVYRTMRLETIAATSPVIVVDGDDLILFREGKRQAVTAVPKSYHVLKAIAHIPLALHLLTRSADGQLKKARLDELQNYVLKLESEQRNRPAKPESPDETIFTESLRLARQVISAKAVTPAARHAFAHKMAPLVLALAANAAKAQIDGYQQALAKWKSELSAGEWKRLKIVVMGSQMPRAGHIAVQYFAWLLRAPGEGKRIIYSEAIFDEQKALGLMATHQIDSDIGVAFFAEERRMHRDLLADAATDILKKMPPP